MLLSSLKRETYGVLSVSVLGNANKPARVGGTQEIMDPASSNRTVRAAPLAGTAPNPFGGVSAAGFPGATPN